MRKTYLIFILILGFITACKPLNAVEQNQDSHTAELECIPPLEKFSYPTSGGEKDGPLPETIIPKFGWQFVTSMPEDITSKTISEDRLKIKFIQNKDGEEKIWLVKKDKEISLIQYIINTQTWGREFSLDALNSQDYLIDPEIFLDRKNEVWLALNPISYDSDGISIDTAVLFKYNTTNQNFDQMLTLQDLAFSKEVPVFKIAVSKIQMDTQGRLWLSVIVEDEAKGNQYFLFRYVPVENNLENITPRINLDRQDPFSFVVTADDVLILLETGNKDIVIFNPATGSRQMLKIPQAVIDNDSIHASSTLFLDNSNRLWLNDNGWVELSALDNWQVINHSPIFINYQYYGNGLWHRTYPTYSLETGDGKLWYSSLRGNGWVNPDTGDWCLFTTYQSLVVMDNAGNLWMVADGKVYKNPLGE